MSHRAPFASWTQPLRSPWTRSRGGISPWLEGEKQGVREEGGLLTHLLAQVHFLGFTTLPNAPALGQEKERVGDCSPFLLCLCLRALAMGADLGRALPPKQPRSQPPWP